MTALSVHLEIVRSRVRPGMELPNPESNPTSYSQPHHDGTSNALADPTFLDRDEAHAVPKPLPPPLQEDRGPTSDMGTDGYCTYLDSGAVAS